MKRLIAAAVLLFCVAASYLFGYFYIQKTCDKANTLLDDCVAAYKTEQNAKNKAEELEKFWGEKEKLLSVFANHSEIDEIELAIYSLKVYSETSDNEIFYEYSGTVKTLLHQLLEDTIPSIHSIF